MCGTFLPLRSNVSGMSNHLRVIVSYGGQFLNLNDEWKWRGDKTTSILVPTSITLTELEVRLKDKLGILDPRTQIELKFKIPNMNIAPAQIRDDEDVKWYISVHNETPICVNVLEAELPSVGMGRDTNCPNCSFAIVGVHQNVQQEDHNHQQNALNNNAEAEREDVSMGRDTNCQDHSFDVAEFHQNLEQEDLNHQHSASNNNSPESPNFDTGTAPSDENLDIPLHGTEAANIDDVDY